MKLDKAMKVFLKALKKDSAYRVAWESNIAMSISDAINEAKRETKKKRLTKQETHSAINKGASNFISLLLEKPKK